MRRKRSTVAEAFAKKLAESGNKTQRASAATEEECVVPLQYHQGLELNQRACVFGNSLRNTFPPNKVVRIVSRQKPRLRLYARAHPDNFSDSVKGISVLRTICEFPDKEVILRPVDDVSEAVVQELVFVLLDRYLSKRDIWHLHLTMMQSGSAVLYTGFDYNLRQHCPVSRVEKMTVGENRESVLCGLVSPTTEVTFKSYSGTMYVLVEISQELMTYSLSGRPYYEVLIDALAEFIEKSVRKTDQAVGDGHYVYMILFARVRTSAQNVKAGGLEYLDYYDMCWEGFGCAMPPTDQIKCRVRTVCALIHQQSASGLPMGDPVRVSQACWNGVKPADLYEARYGCTLEALNIIMDHFDQYHMDRPLRVTGQVIVHFTAGNGVLQASSKELYELTHKRFATAGPSSHHPYNMICVCGPPMHEVPWVQWPGGPGPLDFVEQVSPESPRESDVHLLTKPTWLRLAYYKDIQFCQCISQLEPVKLARMLDLPSLGWAPCGSHAERDHRPVRLRIPEIHQENELDVDELDAPIKKVEKLFGVRFNGHVPPRGRLVEAEVTYAGQQLWEDLRAIRLQPYYRVEANEHPQRRRRRSFDLNFDTYTLSPSRFDERGVNSELEKLDIMNDLIGCRLEARTSELIVPAETDMYGRAVERTRVAAGSRQTWHTQTELLPPQLKRCTVRAANGRMQWSMDTMSHSGPNLEVKFEEFKEKAAEHEHGGQDKKPWYQYGPFCVRHMTIGVPSFDVEADSTIGQPEHDWVVCSRRFHMPMRPQWNAIDRVIAGNDELKSALPYPVMESSKDSCPHWKLRSAVKQHLYMLMPSGDTEWSHTDHFNQVVEDLGGTVPLGVNPFEMLDQKPSASDIGGEAAKSKRAKILQNFEKVIKAFNYLCFGHENPPDGAPKISVEPIVDGSKFIVSLKTCPVYIKHTTLPSAFTQSRDWFMVFYDSLFSPPRPFIFWLQWMVCSSVHVSNVLRRFKKFATDNGFKWMRIPIAQLFPQPAPSYVWSENRETNFDRLTWHAPMRIVFPIRVRDGEEGRRRRDVELLRRWLEPPLDFFFVFSSAHEEFKVEAVLDLDSQDLEAMDTRRQQLAVHSRIKGWVLCHKSGFCLVALRTEYICWYDNRLQYAELLHSNEMSARLQYLRELRRQFLQTTVDIIKDFALEGEGPVIEPMPSDDPVNKTPPLGWV